MTRGPQALPIRKPDLDYDEDTDPVWTPRRPEFACAANSVSLLMPYMEPYFVRSVSAALPYLDTGLRDQARCYLGQETQHQHQHRRFNRFLTGNYRWLTPIERAARWTYHRLGATRSLEFNLGVAASSEAIAYAAARWAAQHRTTLFDGADPTITSLFVWHLAEEVEHKSVAFDVFAAVGGSRRRYLAAMIVSVILVTTFVTAGTTVMLAAERRLWHPLAWWRLTGWAVSFAFELVPTLVLSALPRFHPDQWADPLWYDVWLREYDATASPD